MAEGDRAAQLRRADSRPSAQIPPRRTQTPLRALRRRLGAFPELNCLRHRFQPAVLAAAELRAAEIGGGAQDVLIAAGHLSEDDYAATLARSLGLVFDRLEHLDRLDCPFDDEQLLAAAAAGSMPLKAAGQLGYAVVPAGLAARNIINQISAHPELRHRLCLTSRDALTRFVKRHAAREWAYRAAFSLAEQQPEFSAADRGRPWRWLVFASGCAMALLAAQTATLFALQILLALVFVEWMAVRVAACLCSPLQPPARTLSDRDLPTYTIVVALYREAAALPALIEGLAGLDYPREKIDIKIVIEADDVETRAALNRLKSDIDFEAIVSPRYGPKTKPKALNAALPFARGTLLAVYDAEDQPDPDQLRCAAEAFAQADGLLACVQARLTIDNTTDSWLTRVYTVEYAGLFDAFLPGIARWRLPLPLGGSSNHFRTSVLRKVGAWDPFNVTEDADLGLRLARLGYRTSVIDSSTYEEAPARFGPWLRQRTRWFKGWIATWQVHMRQPLRLLRELGSVNFIVFQLIVGGSVLAALVHPIFLVAFAISLTLGERSPSEDMLAWFYGGTFALGYVVSAFVGWMGLARRGLPGLAWWLALIPVYWWCLSLAAWRAVYQAAFDPYRWEKTDHGLAKSSRRRDDRGFITRP